MTSPRPTPLRLLAPGVGALFLFLFVSAWAPASAATANPDPDAALVQQTCTGCHGAAVFTSRHQDKDAWTKTVRQMIQNGADVPDTKFDSIVAYLANHYGPAKAPSRSPQ